MVEVHGNGLLRLMEVMGTDPMGKEVPYGPGSSVSRKLSLGPFGTAMSWHNAGYCGGKSRCCRGGLALAYG